MKRTLFGLTFALGLLALSGSAVAADAVDAGGDGAMLKMASASGCMVCHRVDPAPPGPDGVLPLSPAWRDVAARYRGQAGALDRLTAVVLTGSNPYASHWQGKVTGLAMPTNAVAIQRDDARALVGWILSLQPLRKM
jgi:cytochrome c